MAQSMVNFRMDEELKKNMESICQELGMSTTTAFTIFARKMTREQRIPFDVCVDPFYSDKNQKALQESIAQFGKGQIITKTMAELEAME